MEKIPLLVVCGPTASGKTAVGVALAKEYNGEIVSADSMQIYKGLSVATAKPTAEEMQGIPHHLIDFLEPDENFSVAEYVSAAKKCIADITARGKLPIVVGGTGLYINSLADNISFDHIISDSTLRRQLEEEAEREGGEHMYRRLCELDPAAAEKIHPNNKIRVIRAVEMCLLSGKTGEENRIESRKEESPYNLCMIGLTCFDRQKLYDRIDRRVDIMLENGLVEEVREVYGKYRLGTAFNAIGYKELIPYLEGKEGIVDCIDKIKQESRRYAKRQLTWFRRDARISWVDTANSEQFDGIINNCKNIVAKSKIM
ncbi:MAG: tRNA (adenosine(37)-N6)-dimethylallyltransferase MiaA [Huintestinicola sp.]